MKYLGYAIKLAIVLIGLCMMYHFPDTSKPPFMSGAVFVLIAIYLQFFTQSVYGSCETDKKKKKEKKKD